MVRGYGKGKFASEDQREAVMAKLKGKGRRSSGTSERTGSDKYDGYQGRSAKETKKSDWLSLT